MLIAFLTASAVALKRMAGLEESGLELSVSELRVSGPESIQGLGLMSQEELGLVKTRTKGYMFGLDWLSLRSAWVAD